MNSTPGTFRYEGYDLDPATTSLTCRYSVDNWRFVERLDIEINEAHAVDQWATPAADLAARLIFLLTGVSYYKTFAPAIIDLGAVPISDLQRNLVRSFYVDGLGEFAYKNDLDLDAVRIEGGRDEPPPAADRPATSDPRPPRVLVPFGGGMDSIVSVEVLRTQADVALLLVGLQGSPFAAIEPPARATRLPVNRASRIVDRQILRSTRLGFMKGHVPINGIITAIAILVAVLTDRDGVALSNEWSASDPTLTHRGRPVNHQYSKSIDFELGLRAVVAEAVARGTQLPDYFSSLRHRGDLSIAWSFAGLDPAYHRTFRSCNEAFHILERLRLDRWCGQCPKCCFKDLILAPFLPAAELDAIFDGTEPLEDPGLVGTFRSLLGISGVHKPFDCVGEPGEARAALRLAGDQEDRRDNLLLQQLLLETLDLPVPDASACFDRVEAPAVPERYAYALVT